VRFVDNPGVSTNQPYAGGTYVWFEHLHGQNRLQPYVPGRNYPVLTLMLRNYVDEFDQGPRMGRLNSLGF
jgi:hypothetical protein